MVITIDYESIDTRDVVKTEWRRYCKQKKGYLYKLTVFTYYHNPKTFWFHSYWKSKYYYWLIKLLK